MQQPFFEFASLDTEIRHKLESMKVPSGELFSSLVRTARADGLDDDGGRRISELFVALCEKFDGAADKPTLNHPIRVAATWGKISGRHSYETLAFGLCHNIRENGGNALKNIEAAFLSANSRDMIGLLTIDRERERDFSYLSSYYDAIEQASGDLLIFKGLDKLDNFLSYAIYDLDPYYFMVLDDFVTPRLTQKHAKLAAYLQNVADRVRTSDAKTTYRSLEA